MSDAPIAVADGRTDDRPARPRLLVLRVVEYQSRLLRRFWRSSVFAYVLNPIMFLGAMGLGLGGLVDQHSGAVSGVSYLVFVAPGLLAAGAMQAAAADSLWPVMYGTKWGRTYHGMVSTPIRPVDVYAGLVTWTAIRAALGASVFLVVATVFGAVPSPWAVLAVPATALTAAAFAALLAAFSATQESDSAFPVIMRIGILPLFLLSGTFFPVDQLPGWLRPVRFLSPLWHGVELDRGATTASISAGSVAVHVAALAACVIAGWLWGRRSFTRRLAS